MIDCHTHLTSLRDDPAEALARARAAGVQRVVTIGSSPPEMAQAAAIAAHDDGVFTTAGLHPHHAAEWSDLVAEEVRRRAAHPRCVAIGETGLDWFRDRAPREQQLEAFRGQLAIARELSLPVVIHCREADDDLFPILADEAPATVILHCFAAVARLDEAVDRGWFCSFAGNVTYPSAGDLQDAARRVPADLILLETDAPYLSPVPHRGRPNEPAYVMDTLRFVAELRGVEPHLLEREVETNAARAYELPLTMASPRQVTLARLHELGIAPDTRLGQHFLIDDNLVRVALRLAELEPDDVVLEVGPGLGVLTAPLADAVRHVHAIELDRRLAPALAATLGGRTNVSVVYADALQVALSELDPAPTAFVSNLPYNVATPLVAESLGRLPTVERWCVMVQREAADRLLARPGTPAYGAVSVLVQLVCEPRGRHAVSRAVFAPPPRVDSALVGLRRRDTWPGLAPRYPHVVAVVQAAFGHRRKTLANALQLAGMPADATVAALEALGLPPGVRAERLSPSELLALADRLAA